MELNFIHKDLPESDKGLFFGPLEVTDSFEVINDSTRLEHILVKAGIFKSLTEARKNGSHGPIEPGFSQITRGKGPKKRIITVLNKWE